MPRRTPATNAPGRRLTALLAEADPPSRDVLADILAARFAEVITAASLAEARDMAQTRQPDLVVAGARFPDGSAAALAAALFAENKRRPVFITGSPQELLDLLATVSLPGLRCLVRPFAIPALEDALDAAAADLTAQHSADDAWQLVKDFLDDSPNPSALLIGHEVASLNRAFLRFMGLGSLVEFKALGLTLDRFLADPPPPEGLAAWAGRLPGDTLDRDHRLRLVRPDRPGAAPQVFQPTVTPLSGRNRCLLTLTDITELELERRELLDLANRDPLTKSLNRRKLGDVLADETARADRYGTPLTVVMLDIDHFKNINDTYGHDVGDSVLIELAARLRACLRQVDRLARYGGEEFVVAAPGIDIQGGLEMAERLRRAVADAPFAQAGPVTASFGVATFRAGEQTENVLKRADEALYRAKAGGRNRAEREALPQPQVR
ncbi:diguanylate cyclase [Desulfovibrio aerotolerans]|uniref:diguanylate cyclase n=1 Tax=Solidesulfovibrio aerotolerans TaxID=295255 RepID=A0A7C9MVM5_9BACT|nr:diguanylate cyclase [Solidesulfovibrio aerotolerans]MYL83714.1 diguanylate cyclase [Solidesulfovibrio aerotolerans]